ncbi:MAG: four-helix bundle copper-binding protein [Telluria sp.]
MALQEHQACIDACDACADACDFCLASCLREKDVKMMARCIALDIDCAQICRMASSYMARDSEFATAVCQMCADVCDSCADECTLHSAEHCRQCAKACRRCAEECRRMAGMLQPGIPVSAGGAAAH